MTLEFAPLAEHICDALLESSPELAASAGDHRFDDRLPDLSPDGITADIGMLNDAAGALSQVDADDLDDAERVDHAILSALVDRQLFELTQVRDVVRTGVSIIDPFGYSPAT